MADKWISRVVISLLNKLKRFNKKQQTGWTVYASVQEVYEGEEKEYPFDWIEEIDEGAFDSLYEDEEADDEDFYNRVQNQRVSLIKSNKHLNQMNEICFFYAAPDAMLKEHHSVLVFQDMNQWLHEMIMKELVPHYKEVKQFFVNGEFKEIQLSGLKKESKSLVKGLISQGYFPIVSDLYRDIEPTESSGGGNLKYFVIRKDSVNTLELQEYDRFKQFVFNKSFQKNKPFVVMPSGWKLQEDLRDSVAIRYFSNFAEQIVLLVNTVDDSIRAIYILGGKCEKGSQLF